MTRCNMVCLCLWTISCPNSKLIDNIGMSNCTAGHLMGKGWPILIWRWRGQSSKPQVTLCVKTLSWLQLNIPVMKKCQTLCSLDWAYLTISPPISPATIHLAPRHVQPSSFYRNNKRIKWIVSNFIWKRGKTELSYIEFGFVWFGNFCMIYLISFWDQ